jgi:hypothetical protein
VSLEDNINEYLKQYAVVKEIKEKLDEQDKEIERLNNIIKEVREYIEEHIKYECDGAFNGMQFYSYHLYDFNKNKLLEILDKESNK